MNDNNRSIKELNEIVKSKLQGIARKVQAELPEGYGFALLTFNFGENEDNEMMYISNANREDVVKSMQEFIEKTKYTYGNDTGKYWGVSMNQEEYIQLQNLLVKYRVACLKEYSKHTGKIREKFLKQIRCIDTLRRDMILITKGESEDEKTE